MQDNRNDPNLDPASARVPAASSEVISEASARSPAKQVKIIPEGVNQADIDAVLKRLASMKKRLREDILFVGGRLAKMRDKRISYGGWTSFVERTFPLSVKTANIWIRAWENRTSELAVNDWDAYMRVLYGNESRKFKALKHQHRQDDDDSSSPKQSGGPGFTNLLPDRGKAGLLAFKNATASLGEFLNSSDYTRDAKAEFVTELIAWLESQQKSLTAVVPREPEEES
jgi:hypothetical protein